MNNVWSWVKSNPVAVICLIIIILAAISFYWPIQVQSTEFKERMADRATDLRQIEQYFRTSITVPAEDPDDQPQQVNIPVKEADIEKLRNLYEDMSDQYTGIFDYAVESNRAGHDPMLPGLFPEPEDAAKPFLARSAYREAFNNPEPEPGSPPGLYQLLDTGTPPTEETVQNLLSQIEESYKNRTFPPLTSLTDEQTAELRGRQAEKLLELYRSRASRIHVYASPEIFQIGEWSRPGPRPELFDVWEGQLQLWIQQDLVTAIRIANEIDTDPNASVIEQPIKQILAMGVMPDYIGVPQGGFPEPVSQDTDQDIKDDFTISPTGRRCCSLYDVRHATLSLIVDSARIPEVVNAVGQVNFMTVINAEVSEVDEYVKLRAGYYFGNVDVIQLDLTIETIWLRKWTAGHPTEEEAETLGEEFEPGLMPDAVRVHLGMEPRDPDFVRETDGDRRMPSGGMEPGMYPGGGPPMGSQ